MGVKVAAAGCTAVSPAATIASPPAASSSSSSAFLALFTAGCAPLSSSPLPWSPLEELCCSEVLQEGLSAVPLRSALKACSYLFRPNISKRLSWPAGPAGAPGPRFLPRVLPASRSSSAAAATLRTKTQPHARAATKPCAHLFFSGAPSEINSHGPPNIFLAQM